MPTYLEELFPKLSTTSYQITSPRTYSYNCIAWAAMDQDNWWWPDEDGCYYWPDEAPREETIEAFIQAYGLSGYEVCDDAQLEAGFEKIALYALNNRPKHAARQLNNGNWTSKLGQLEDIEHTLDGLVGNAYGAVVQFMRRPVIS